MPSIRIGIPCLRRITSSVVRVTSSLSSSVRSLRRRPPSAARVAGLSCTVLASKCAYPSDGTKCVGVADVGLKPLRREVYDNGEIFDITRKFSPHTLVGGSVEGIGQFNKLLLSMKNGSDYNFSEMRIPVHSGTHVDAPDHFYDNYYDACFDVDSLDLRVLNGAALFVDVLRGKNITAQVMKSLHIPKGVKRVLFRTLNTDRRLMYKKEFDTSFVGFMTDGAQWLVDNTGIIIPNLWGLITCLLLLLLKQPQLILYFLKAVNTS
ncbi:hypothetical protein ACS0TY_013968 [Phlomoides rotata]